MPLLAVNSAKQLTFFMPAILLGISCQQHSHYGLPKRNNQQHSPAGLESLLLPTIRATTFFTESMATVDRLLPNHTMAVVLHIKWPR